jgi:hypothetical protein
MWSCHETPKLWRLTFVRPSKPIRRSVPRFSVADPERGLPLAPVGDVELDRACVAANRHVGQRLEIDVSRARDQAAAERELRVVLDIEEVGAAQMRVADGLAGPDLGRVGLPFERRLEAAVPVELELAVDVLEETPDPGHHHVARPETDLCVAGLKDPARHLQDPMT